ncbi:flagellar basal body rod protein FlgB [Silanimonas lenta]|uniref:flagellar basal body rod protein FlgB n=1 Tax=Silanimonas lenta TaxID=265429 RepID=UPI0004290186|nr:flagellar basal body rod protein FlgB [Silanimonas lenta]
MAGPFDNPFGLSALALPLREQRLRVLSSNLANADTPGYQAQDFDFQAALRGAEAALHGPAPRPASGSPTVAAAAMGLATAPDYSRYVSTRRALQGSLDGNTVDSETEHAAFGRAVLEYRASLTFFEQRVRGLMTAITGQ